MLNTNHGITLLSIFPKLGKWLETKFVQTHIQTCIQWQNTQMRFSHFTQWVMLKSRSGKAENSCLGKGNSQYVDQLPKHPNKVLFIAKHDVLAQIWEIHVQYLKSPNWYEDKIHVWKTCTISMFGKINSQFPH